MSSHGVMRFQLPLNGKVVYDSRRERLTVYVAIDSAININIARVWRQVRSLP